MNLRLEEILIALSCLVLHQKTTIAYDPTIPNIAAMECVRDLCTTPALPSCFGLDSQTPLCSVMYGCGYDGAGETVSACTTYTDTSKHVDEKHYRLT